MIVEGLVDFGDEVPALQVKVGHLPAGGLSAAGQCTGAENMCMDMCVHMCVDMCVETCV